MKGKIKDIFLCGNTAQGFHSFYKYILSEEDTKRIIYIKGAPGKIKTSLMKNIGSLYNNKGYDIEYYHCSLDSSDLDGIVIKNINIAIIDGTPPHVADPINPLVIDEIINLGEVFHEDSLLKHKKNIIEENKQIAKSFDRAYRFLGAAKLLHEDWSSFNHNATYLTKINYLQKYLSKKIFSQIYYNPSPKLAYCDHFFATAFTCDGIITFIKNLYDNYENKYILNGAPGTYKSNVLNFLADEALKNGLNVEVYHHPLLPDKIEHILIPDINTAVLTANEINNMNFEGVQIFMGNYGNASKINKNKEEVNYVKNTFNSLISKSISLINEAKNNQDILEEYYINNIDPDKLSEITNTLMGKISKYEKDYSVKNP